MGEIVESAARSAGDVAGVFEFDGETSYFYLFKAQGGEGKKVLDSIRITSGVPDFAADDVAVRWDSSEQKVGLFLRGVLWALFDTRLKSKHGGDYSPTSRPEFGASIGDGFDPF